MRCQFDNCLFESEDLIVFSRHLQFTHKIKSEDYSIRFLCNGIRPTCHECDGAVRYVRFTFKKYCKEHSYVAESEAGAIGGKIKKTWSKGLTKKDHPLLMQSSKRYTGSGNPFYGKKHPTNAINASRERCLLTEEDIRNRLSKRESDFEFFFSYEDYTSRQYQYIRMKCRVCGTEDEKTLLALERGSRCAICFPLNTSSQPEQEIEDYFKELGISDIVRNTRKVIHPKELDIYLPIEKIAVEYNGLFWHSEEKVGKQLHLEKTKACLVQDIDIFHIFSDEWTFKKEIVKSMLQHRVKKSKIKIMARKCVVKEVLPKEANVFFEKTHIAGAPAAIKKAFGLYSDDRLVACLALKVPYCKKSSVNDKVIENARFALELNTAVIGGFSRLLNTAIKWAKDCGYEEIKSFADRRFGEGRVYATCGFVLVGNTEPNYWYTDGERRYFRTHFRAGNGLTEHQISTANGVYRVYGCGSNIYSISLTSS